METKDMIRDLVYSIADGNAVEIENNFNAVMAQKVSAALDDYRVDVAKTMFNPPEETE